MTVNYFIKCPICGSVTRMRSPAGYVYKTPVHIHCGKCNTLLTGEFISDNDNIKAYYTPSNCSQVIDQDYEYYGEASGELLCRKIVYSPNDKHNFLPPNLSPVFGLMDAMSYEDIDNYIDFVCYACELSSEWNTRRIKYDLFLNKKYELIKGKFRDEACKYGYDLFDEYNIIRFIYFSYFRDCGGIFKRKEIKRLFQDINYHFSHMDRVALDEYLAELDKDNRLETIQSKVFKIMSSFCEITPYLIPAIEAVLYNDRSKIDKKILGMSTCTFDDIKQFYQDTFEILAECCDIVIGLDNIENRSSFYKFENKLDMTKFREQRKGNRIKHLNKKEYYANVFNLKSDANDLRNAIGHNDYSYDGISQEITYIPNAANSVEKQAYLLDVAIECIQLLQSTYILTFLVYELFRYKKRKGYESLELHPIFYTKTKSQNHCPCGSRKKYRDCCKKQIEIKKKEIPKYYYPKKADTNM